MIVLDTNVLSEALKPSPSARVTKWLAGQHPVTVFTTAVTQAEVLYGVERLPSGKRRAGLLAAVTAIFEEDLSGRILPFDAEAAALFPKVVLARASLGRPISQLDAMIASIVRCRNFALATRNVSDFEGCGIRIVNPWQE